jgi:DNA-binding NtrC family response regulator
MARRVAYRILTEEGFRVLEADSGAEALDVLRLARGRLDLLVLDVVMPECDGVAVGRHVLEQWPDQRILYMSAHPAQVLAQHGLTSLNVPFLAKPYTRGEVLAKVTEALERRHKKQRVLVVDDDPSIRSALAKMLTIAGYEVMLAVDGREATRLLQERPADLVIMDPFTPGEDELGTLGELRAKNPDVPIIAMAGGGVRANIGDPKLLGITMTVEKPFMPADVMQIVDAALKGRRNRGA